MYVGDADAQENGVKNSKRTVWVWLVAGWLVLGLSGETFGQTTAKSGETVSPRDAVRAGINDLLAGKIEQGIADIQGAYRRSPENAQAEAAERAVAAYQQTAAAAEAQRKAEYASTVQRIDRAMMSQDALADLGDAHKTLRVKIRDMSGAYGRTSSSDVFADAAEKHLPSLQETALTALSESRVALADTAAIVAKLPESAYTKTFAQLTETADKALANLETAWKNATFETLQEQKDSAVALMEAEEPLQDALIDLETVVADYPWKVALIQTRIAKQIAVPADKMREQAWYKNLLEKVEARGEAAAELASKPWLSGTAAEAVPCAGCELNRQRGLAPPPADGAEADIAKGQSMLHKTGVSVCGQECANLFDGAKWYDALTAYAGLEDLEHDNTTYQERSKEVRSHVRVLRMYGASPVAATSQPASSDDEEAEDETRLNWKDFTKGIDRVMIDNAISKINVDYVTKPDFRTMTLGALRSIRILAETPQSANSFAKLGDDETRKKFLATIDRLIDDVRAKDNVEYKELTRCLNNVIDASRKTVDIPLSVLAMEYTDGFLSELDPFSSMIWPNDLSDFRKSTQGKFFGVGIQITKGNGEPLRVVTPLRGSPALEAGIKTGDTILTVDGKNTREYSRDKLITMIMGPAGTKVTFEIERRGQDEPLTIEVERREISIQTVKGWHIDAVGNYDYMLDETNKIAYVRLTQFSEDTHEDLRAVLSRLKADGVRSLIIDLRFNPGGYLRQAVDVANEFVPKGKIVSTAGQQTPNAQVIEGRGGGQYLKGDLVVLINENSASAAEIVSGAMKDYKRATIIGERTYGKGSVQNVIEVSREKAFLKLTTSYYYLPSGRLLHRENGSTQWGVDPDINVTMTPRQLRRWLDIRGKTELILDNPGEELDNDLRNQYKADLPLNMAVLVLRLKQIQEMK